MAAEMNLHLGYRPSEDRHEGYANERNGGSGKTVRPHWAGATLSFPEIGRGSFAPILILCSGLRSSMG